MACPRRPIAATALSLGVRACEHDLRMSDAQSRVDAPAAARLGAGEKLAYGLGDTAIAARLTAVQLHLLPFYTDVVFLPAWLAGVGRMLGLVWDGVNDPVAGWLSDRTRTRLGRRRPFILAAAVPMGLAFCLLWTPPAGLGTAGIFLWFVLAYVLLDTFVTLYTTPYLALGAELTDDYHERTQVSAMRSAFHVVGLLAGALIPGVVLEAYGADRTRGHLVMGLAIGGAMAGVGLVTGLLVRERATHAAPLPRDAHGLVRGIARTLRNRPFRVLLVTFALLQIGGGCYQTVLPYAFRYWLHMPDRVGTVLAVYLLSSVASLPLWTRLAWRLGKDRALRLCIVWGATSLAVAPFVLSPDLSAPALYGFLVLAGLGAGGWNVLPVAITADVVDADELETAERREGAYFGLWTLTLKLATALASAVVGVGLAVIGYVPNVEQTAGALLGLKLLYGPIPAVLLLGGLLAFAGFPLTRERHAAVQAALAARRHSRPAAGSGTAGHDTRSASCPA